MAKEFKITSARLVELEEELNYLKTTREKEVAELIKEARSFGDLSENSEYDEAKNEQAKLYGRIAEVENILANAVVIDENDERIGVVSLGCTIKVEDLEFGDIEIYAIVGSSDLFYRLAPSKYGLAHPCLALNNSSQVQEGHRHCRDINQQCVCKHLRLQHILPITYNQGLNS